MLTLYYVSATFLQSWRISKICQKISDQLAQQATISFYVLPNEKDKGFYSKLATSELCGNRHVAKVTDILWLQGNHRGCSLMPKQSLQTSGWISFPPTAPGLQPFHFYDAPASLKRSLSGNPAGHIRLLLEIETTPCYDAATGQRDIVRLENYGKLLAWKIDSHLAVLIETDIEHFTKLLNDTFLQNHLLINDQLPLLRIESVKNDGTPQPYAMLRYHLRKPVRNAEVCKPDEWTRHLEDLRALGVLANQAIEYASTKSKTSGKSSPIKPDLIPQEKKQPTNEPTPVAAASGSTTKESPKRTQGQPQKADSLEKKDIVDSAKPKSPEKAKVSAQQSQSFIKAEQANQMKPATASKAEQKPSPSAEEAKAGQGSPSPSRHKAKPTEIKKPGAVDTSRFKTSKLPEAALAGPSSRESSELEKIAAAKVAERTKSKSPSSTNETKASPSKEKDKSPVKAPLASSEANQSNKPSQKAEIKTASASEAKTKEQTKIIDVAGTSSTEVDASATKPSVSTAAVAAVKDASAKRPSLKRHKDSIKDCKPLNVLVYAETATARESAMRTLRDILTENTYTICPMTQQQAEQRHWKDTAALLVVCGSVANGMGEIFVDYFLHGGKVLSLCSDVLHFVLPTYRTAEVREHELVQFSYDKWQRVKMMHHIFCYQPSPVKKNFSTDSDDSAHAGNRKPALVCPPRSIELKDLKGHLHQLDVHVLGTEETWNTPSLLLASNPKSGGNAVFSQVHLEISPAEFESDESKYAVLKQNDAIRHEIFSDLLKKHLSLSVKPEKVTGMALNGAGAKCVYQNAYFLGRHEAKFELLQKLKDKTGADNAIATPNLIMKFCGPDDKLPNVNSNILPILIHSCPEDFSTVEYFDDLKTNYVGRLVIYAPLINSSQNVVSDLELSNGIAVIPRQQTAGVGRSNNQWLSPLGCAMFSLQLHIALDTPLGKRLALLQHIIGAAMVNTIKGHHLYKVLNIGLKWPNDAYANGSVKIGGIAVRTTLIGNMAIVNIGCGFNLDNGKPTICINDMIREYNQKHQQSLPLLKYEQFIALMFNEIERLVEAAKSGDFETFYKLYYELWMHSDQLIGIVAQDGSKKDAKVSGIDDYGYLRVKLENGSIETVMPDGNSFDMLKGLIVPKFN